MSADSENAGDVLRSIWQQAPAGIEELDDECSPTKEIGRAHV